MTPLLVGIDIGQSSVKVAWLKPTREGIKLLYAGLRELSFEELAAADKGIPQALSEFFQVRGLKRRKVAVNFADKNLVIRHLTLPLMPEEELAEALRWEARKMLASRIEDIILDFLITRELEEVGIKRSEILLIATEKPVLQRYYRFLKAAGLRVAAIDVDPLAQLNAVKLNHPTALEEGLAFVDIGDGKMEINIAKNGALGFTRTVQMGGHDLTQFVARELKLAYPEAEQWKRQKGLAMGNDNRLQELVKKEVDRFILEVRRSIEYYQTQFRGQRLAKIVLMGGTPLMLGFRQYFSSYFDTEVELDDPFAGLMSNGTAFQEARAFPSRFSTCVGLALRTKGS